MADTIGTLAPGDHICGLYPTVAERDDILGQYLSVGVDSGDKCLCVIDDITTTAKTVLANISAHRTPDRHQIDIRRATDTNLRGDQFSAESAIAFWDEQVQNALSTGFKFVRVFGEMTWSLRPVPGIKEFLTYEAKLNDWLPRYPQAWVCLYELDRFAGEALVNILQVHPTVLLGGVILHNPYYVPPGEFLDSSSNA